MRLTETFTMFFFLVVSACTSGGAAVPPEDHRRSIAVEVGAHGYAPHEVTATAGEEVRLVFTRTSDEGCGQQLVLPDLNIRRDLPLDQAVPVDITMPASGAVAFTCGMGMYRGSVVVR